MRTTTLAALLWWVEYSGPDAFGHAGASLDSIESNFIEWTESKKERDAWRKIAKSMKAQAAEGAKIAKARKERR